MRSGTWFSEIWNRFRKGVVQDVPPSLEECEACRETECTQERWLTCERRLAGEARARPQTSSGESQTATTDELPKLKSSSQD